MAKVKLVSQQRLGNSLILRWPGGSSVLKKVGDTSGEMPDQDAHRLIGSHNGMLEMVVQPKAEPKLEEKPVLESKMMEAPKNKAMESDKKK